MQADRTRAKDMGLCDKHRLVRIGPIEVYTIIAFCVIVIITLW